MNAGMLKTIATALEKNSEKANPIEEGDYQRDGLWYCGKCNTPKQCFVELFGEQKTVFCLCQCKQEEKVRREYEDKAERRKRAYERLIERSCMDERSLNARFENAVINEINESNMKLCKAYAERFDEMYQKNRGLLFMGASGTGKTYAAACIANTLLDRYIGVKMVSFARLCNMAKDVENIDAFEDELTEVPLLIIDDLGAQRDTSYAKEKVYNVINMRYEAEKPMIITTNITSSKEMQGTETECARVFDRILETCMPVKWEGKSWRTLGMNSRMDEFKKELGL